VIKTQNRIDEPIQDDKVKIYGIKITRESTGCYGFSITHSGPFKLGDYDELELRANAVKMVPRFG